MSPRFLSLAASYSWAPPHGRLAFKRSTLALWWHAKMADIEALMLSDAAVILMGLATLDEPFEDRLRLRYNLAAMEARYDLVAWLSTGLSGIWKVTSSGRKWRARSTTFPTKPAAFHHICEYHRRVEGMPPLPDELPDPDGCALNATLARVGNGHMRARELAACARELADLIP